MEVRPVVVSSKEGGPPPVTRILDFITVYTNRLKDDILT
jgi:hypothetical protein